jgi:hypothetical protein
MVLDATMVGVATLVEHVFWRPLAVAVSASLVRLALTARVLPRLLLR